MTSIQAPQPTHIPARPRSYRYYATGAAAHLALSGGVWVTGFGWSGVPLFAAAILAVLAVRAWRRNISHVNQPPTRRWPTTPTVLHFDAKRPTQ